ncbi:MAG: N-acylglucosamine 2-epimerase [Micavibrio aeruginosavorus]|uniref:N-acylglucosamine 2-epimerase n=1 Tax=Micavibrio aeruginosavorus TaxID=349221 RepID=A0A2W5BXX5_9BACT|nr:MAG: N-acylglucosamine 2-epimerase [Micavibrio aeruginosavorus]
MALGLHSTIYSLHMRLALRWCPKWRGAFVDPAGGYYERLGKGFQPVLTGQRRLVTQCRQLSIYSHYALKNSKIKSLSADLQSEFDYIVSRYHDPETGLWHFSLDDNGRVLDRTCDLYALSFVIFSFSHYYRATLDDRARVRALEVLTLIDRDFRLETGLAEALGPDGKPLAKMRRQNPHMHLLEACLFAYETWRDDVFLAMADEMVALFCGSFFDEGRCALVEFFDDALNPHPEKGAHVEPGHYFEWIWLLKMHGGMTGATDRHDAVCLKLLDWANRHGWDSDFGGIYDTLTPDGAVIADTKRIWPFCEALKANALMLTAVPDRQALKDRVAEMVAVFDEKYMDERGFWTEWLNRDLTPAVDYMPGTTPYHVYFGIEETMDILNGRGGGKSWRAPLTAALYSARRFVSGAVRSLKGI